MCVLSSELQNRLMFFIDGMYLSITTVQLGELEKGQPVDLGMWALGLHLSCR